MKELYTERLVLRAWQAGDVDRWAEINADPEVREFLGPPWTAEEAAESIERYREGFAANGFGFWAVAERATGRLIGFAGLDAVDEETPFDGVEAGWRLARDAWGHGYATEAARAVLHEAFTVLGLDEVFALTESGNLRSQAVMRRLGLERVPAKDFDNQVVFHILRENLERKA